MKDSARYAKIVEWSEEDGCYVGRAPGLMDGGVHGSDERAVFAELCDAVEAVIELYKEDGKPLPPTTIGAAGLVETMIDDLHPGDEDAHSLWLEEAERRYAQYVAGKVEAIPGDEAMDEARKRSRRDI